MIISMYMRIPFNHYCYRHFSLHGTHLVDALRHFLESFRLPGESPVIARILETFSEHWLVNNYDDGHAYWYIGCVH